MQPSSPSASLTVTTEEEIGPRQDNDVDGRAYIHRLKGITMRRSLWCLLVVAFPLGVVSFADEVTLERPIYTRQSLAIGEPGTLLTVYIIDVGGGDAILIDTPSDKKILIDGGWTRGEDAVVEPEYRAYLDRFLGNDEVDLIIISHPDYDHFIGLEEVVRTHKVEEAWYTGYDSPQLSASWGRLVKELKTRLGPRFVSPVADSIAVGRAVVFDNGGTPDHADDTVLTIINAPSEISDRAYGSNRQLTESQRRNSSSMVVRLDYGKTSFLFTGDTNGRPKGADSEACDDQERCMFDQHRKPHGPLSGQLRCTVLKVPHHGSDGSSSLPFLRAIHPQWAVISAGIPHGHPDQGALDRLRDPSVRLKPSHLLRTDEGEDDDTEATEANVGDDCYQFIVDLKGLAKVEEWTVHPSPN